METLPYVILAVGSSILAIVAAIRFTLQHHEARNKVSVLIILGSVIWLLMSALVVASDSLPTKLVFYKMQFVGVLIVPTSWLILTMQLSGYERWIKRSNLVVLTAVPVITLLLIFTNESHGLMWSNITLNSVDPFLPFNENRGLGYWLLIVGYSYVALTFAVIIFVRRAVASRSLYRHQAVPLIFILCVAWVSSAVWFLNPSLFMYIDPTPLALTVAMSITFWRLAYLPGSEVIPVAHETILDSMSEAVIILNAQSRIVELNPSAQQLVGHNLSDALGKPVERIWAEWADVKKKLDSGTDGVKEASFGVGEKKKFYEIQTSYLSGITIMSERPNLLIILRDITERKISDEKLRLYSKQLKEHSEHLEELVAERTNELRKAERLAAIGETAAMVGHDLRNPLQGIAAALHLLRQQSLTTNERDEMLQLIQNSIESADAIVRDLSEYSAEIILELADTTPKSLTREAIRAVKVPPTVSVQDLSQNHPTLKVDTGKIKRVLVNLIQNSISAMPQGGTLMISSRLWNDTVEIALTDTGSGMPENVMKNLWKPLQTTKAKGLGLGLPICKRIVDAHQGTISVKSKAGEGTTVTIGLPIKPVGVEVKQN
jgi:PAS domain S-box-containing protein